MSLVQILVEYVLVYSTAKGLAAIGEPSSSRLYRKGSFRNKSQTDNEDETSLPVWIISIFVSLAALNYILTFMVCHPLQIQSDERLMMVFRLGMFSMSFQQSSSWLRPKFLLELQQWRKDTRIHSGYAWSGLH